MENIVSLSQCPDCEFSDDKDRLLFEFWYFVKDHFGGGSLYKDSKQVRFEYKGNNWIINLEKLIKVYLCYWDTDSQGGFNIVKKAVDSRDKAEHWQKNLEYPDNYWEIQWYDPEPIEIDPNNITIDKETGKRYVYVCWHDYPGMGAMHDVIIKGTEKEAEKWRNEWKPLLDEDHNNKPYYQKFELE